MDWQLFWKLLIIKILLVACSIKKKPVQRWEMISYLRRNSTNFTHQSLFTSLVEHHYTCGKRFFFFSYKALWGSAGSRACSDKPLEVMSPEATSAGSEDDEV